MARSTFKVLFYVNGSKEKDGIVPIMGRVTINGTVAQFSCKQTIPKTLWDAKGNRAKGKSAEARNVNLALDNIKAQIIKHYQRISDREAYVTAEMVRNAYQGVGSEYETLIKAFDKDCANFLKRVGKDRSIGTYKVMVRARNYVAAFIKSFYRRTDMSMLELTPDFIREFAAYLTAERGLKNATIWLNCMWLKGVVMRAHYNGLIPRNPFAQFHISPNVKEREYLTEDEIKRIMAHEFDNPTLALVRDLFIFACFTALSFVDMKELTTDEIVEVNGEKWILSKRHKTNVPFQVKLLDIPLQIIERYKYGRQAGFRENQLLDDVQTTEKGNGGMRNREANLLPLRQASSFILHAENKQFIRICFFLTGNDLATVLLQYSAFLCVTSFFPLAPVGFINAFILSHSAHFHAFHAAIPEIFCIFISR